MKIENTIARMVRRKSYLELTIFLAVLLFASIFTYSASNTGNNEIKADTVNQELAADSSLYVVTRVIDGDTFVYDKNGQATTVRLIGVDTPEIKDPRKPVQCFGQEASNYTKSLLVGQKVKLVTDAYENNLDKYGRELKYVWREDGLFVNADLIEKGYAFATPQYKFEYRDKFSAIQELAEENKTGLWNPEKCNY